VRVFVGVSKLGSTKMIHLSSLESKWMGRTIATTFLPRSYCQKYSRYHSVGFLSVDRTVPRRFEHVRPSLSFSERKTTSFLKHCGRRIHRLLTQSTNSICTFCSAVQEKVYSSRIANVNELKTRLIDEWERFDQDVWRGCCYRPVAASSQLR